jgi:hypothetical protein
MRRFGHLVLVLVLSGLSGLSLPLLAQPPLPEPAAPHIPSPDRGRTPVRQLRLKTPTIPRQVIEPHTPAGFEFRLIWLHQATTRVEFMAETGDAGHHLSPVEIATLIPHKIATLIQAIRPRVVLFPAPMRHGLDWLERDGWRCLWGFLAPRPELDPSFFVGTKDRQTYLFVTGSTDPQTSERMERAMRQMIRYLRLPVTDTTTMRPRPAPGPNGNP